MSRKLGLSFLAVGAGVVLLVSGAFASPQVRSARGGTLQLVWGANPDSVDPALANGNVGSWTLLFATCAKLFNTLPDADTHKRRLVPEVVRSYRVTNGSRTYTFELRRTFRFDTGERVNARSFADAFNRNADPRMDSRVRPFMRVITGAEAAMRSAGKKISGVQVLGPYRLRIHLKRPTGDFRDRLALPYFCPITPGTAIDPRGMNLPPASGPYSVKKNIPNRQIVLERNPYYGGGRIANPDRIVWTVESDWRERLKLTEQAKSDFMTLSFGAPEDVVRGVVARYGVNRPGGQLIRSTVNLSYFLFRFNLDRPAFEGARQAPLRKAINYVLDRRALSDAHGYLAARSSDRLLPGLLSKRRPIYPLDAPDRVAALRWLARASHRPATLELYTVNFPPFGFASAQMFVSNLRPLGITVRVHPFDAATLAEKLETPGEPWDVALVNSSAPYPDPAGVLIPLLQGTRYEARVNAADRLTGPARAKAWADLEADLMRNDPPVAVYASFTPLILTSRNFGCWGAVNEQIDLAAVCKK